MSLVMQVPVNITASKYILGTKNYSYDSLSRLTEVMRETWDEEQFS